VCSITHSTNLKQRTTQADLDEIEDRTDRAARRIYQDASWGLATLIYSILATAMHRWRSSSWTPSSGTASNAAMP
jgi:hypothetical protein